MPSSGDEGESGARSGGAPVEFTSQQITEWKAILKPNKIHKADQARVVQLACISVLIKRIERLPRTDITKKESRKFLTIEKEAEEALGKAKLLNKSFISAITEQDTENPNNPVFEADQVNFQDVLDS